MKEKLYTIPMIDAVAAHTECPFCYIEQKIEAEVIDDILGSGASYMESHVRVITDEQGFCREHYKKMFEYGNSLGNGWILKTHYMNKMAEMKKVFRDKTTPPQKKKFSVLKREEAKNPIVTFVQNEQDSCYVCNEMKKSYERYVESFLMLYLNDAVFKKNVVESQGFCIRHLGDLCEVADRTLKPGQVEIFYREIEELMLRNMERMFEDVSWLIEKYDYKNKESDWRTSKDAVPRSMQKLKGYF